MVAEEVCSALKRNHNLFINGTQISHSTCNGANKHQVLLGCVLIELVSLEPVWTQIVPCLWPASHLNIGRSHVSVADYIPCMPKVMGPVSGISSSTVSGS